MRRFAALIEELDSTNKTTKKVAALTQYFKAASKEDALWAVALLSHRRPSRPVTTTLMRAWAAELAQLPEWLFEESYHIVGDLAETIALLVQQEAKRTPPSLSQCIEEIIALKPKEEEEKKAYILHSWQSLDNFERFVFNKILTGGFRIGVSQKLMTRALSKAVDIDENILAHRLMGQWSPQTTTFDELILNPNPEDQISQPYPFFLAYALEDDFQEKEAVENWHIEHKWDGMRAQLIVREDKHFLWSRGEELITDKFPELACLADHLPNGTVVDGELLPYKDEQIGDFNALQKRIGRKTVSQKLQKDIPIVIMLYDLLEWEGKDVRALPLAERQDLLAKLYHQVKADNVPLLLSEVMQFSSWKEVALEREKAAEKRSEGLMLKHRDSPYAVGRKKGTWWKWKSDPKTIDAVLTYAMRGHGRRTNLYTDYTFGLWQEDTLVTFAKAYSGLTDAEIKKVDHFVKQNTLDRFGPVRQVKPELVFEIAFEGIAASPRHKSGVAVRFPRILRWRHDKKITDANSLEDLKQLLP
ncbi:ATP-dependent DNA ligase [Flavobacteriaceae bacterium]|jgi:DNA ligase-1|nr:ATP-dependent DNA ligase [Flavobacteriaceae bacterium]